MTTEINGRKILFENKMCRISGLMATCNCCDRIIFEDENWLDDYQESGGYCRECANEAEWAYCPAHGSAYKIEGGVFLQCNLDRSGQRSTHPDDIVEVCECAFDEEELKEFETQMVRLFGDTARQVYPINILK